MEKLNPPNDVVVPEVGAAGVPNEKPPVPNLNPEDGADVTETVVAGAVIPGFRVSQAGHFATSALLRTQHPGHSQDPSLGLNLSKMDGFEFVFVSVLAGSPTLNEL